MSVALMRADPASPDLPEDFATLVDESMAEGHRFLERSILEWRADAQRFRHAGETFLLARDDGVICACGGLTRDPYVDDPRVGRLRHIFVRAPWRQRGLATGITAAAIAQAAGHFALLRLRAANPAAVRVYERQGFRRIVSDTATHARAMT